MDDRISILHVSLHKFHDNSGAPLDAHFEAQAGELLMRSRGGTFGTANAQNTEYSPALRILLERIDQSDFRLAGVWVDSNSKRVQKLPMDARRIFFPADKEVSPAELFTTLSNRMAAVGRNPDSHSRGNPTKKLRFVFIGNPAAEWIVRFLGWGHAAVASGQNQRLSAAELNLVSSDHIWHAVDQFLTRSVEHPYRKSRKYDVVTDDGQHLPPKAVFGLAASEALGFEVLPQHFESTDAIREKIREAGFRVVPKNKSPPEEVPPNPEDRVWTEGRPRFCGHLKRERASGLAQAKKAVFRRKHGRLFCEKCGLDPVEEYGPDAGEACIEVHHKLPLAQMPPEISTQLKDLVCVCANCHRIIHRELRNSR